jgi:hypothetical protein
VGSPFHPLTPGAYEALAVGGQVTLLNQSAPEQCMKGHEVSNRETTWYYHVKELFDGTGDAGEDMVCCTQCCNRIETITTCFRRSDGEPLCAACAQAGEVEE